MKRGLSRSRPRADRLSERAAAHRRAMLAPDRVAFEVVPLTNLDAQIPSLPPGARVSVTCSPNKGVDVTLDICEQLADLGHQPIPHLAARMVADRQHLARIVDRCAAVGVRRAFVVGGDAADAGRYPDGEALIEELLAREHPFIGIGVPAYPDGHAVIEQSALHEAIHRKQDLLAAAGVAGWCSTQMCFDAGRIADWLVGERSAGLTLPVHLGVAGSVDKAKLVATGMRIGVGQSLRYLKKNRASLTKMMVTSAYDPDDVLMPLAESAPSLRIDGVHLFTFNQIESTATWLDAIG